MDSSGDPVSTRQLQRQNSSILPSTVQEEQKLMLNVIPLFTPKTQETTTEKGWGLPDTWVI